MPAPLPRVALAVTLVLGVALAGAAARAASGPREERVKRFLAGAERERARLRLTPAELDARSGTVTIELSRPELRPGQTYTVRAKGTFAPGSLFIVERDDVAVAKEKQARGSWQAELRVSPIAAPGEVEVSVYQPVTGSKATAWLGELPSAPVTVSIDLADGRALRVEPARARNPEVDGGYVARVTRGGKAVGETPAAVAFEEGALHVLTCARVPGAARRPAPGGNEEEEATPAQELLRAFAGDPEYQALREEDPGCFEANLFDPKALPEERRMDCLMRHGPAVARIVTRTERARAQAPRPPAKAKAADPLCGRARLRVGEAGALDGTFEAGEFGPDWSAIGASGPATKAKGSWRYAAR